MEDAALNKTTEKNTKTTIIAEQIKKNSENANLNLLTADPDGDPLNPKGK